MPVETVLETARLRLTNWAPEHLDDLVRLHGDPEITRYFSTSGAIETLQQVRDRLTVWGDLFAAHRLGKLRVTLRADGAFIGRAGFGIYAPTGTPEIGFAFLRSHWGHGYATEAAAGLRDWYFKETDRDSFIGYADTRNHVSIKVLRAIGMLPTHIGREPDGMECAFHILKREDWHD